MTNNKQKIKCALRTSLRDFLCVLGLLFISLAVAFCAMQIVQLVGGHPVWGTIGMAVAAFLGMFVANLDVINLSE